MPIYLITPTPHTDIKAMLATLRERKFADDDNSNILPGTNGKADAIEIAQSNPRLVAGLDAYIANHSSSMDHRIAFFSKTADDEPGRPAPDQTATPTAPVVV